MIVVDTNVLAYYLLGGPNAEVAAAALRRDPDWIAPPIWRSEFRSVLAQSMRAHALSLQAATEVFERAELLLGGRDHRVDSSHVLAISQESGCSTYDCEFVSLAMQQGTIVVTADSQVVGAFPGVAQALTRFGVIA